MSVQEATEKYREASGRLCELAKEQKGLPGQIQAAAEAGDSETLAKLSARKIACEAEYVTAMISDKEAQISCFEAELAEAQSRANELTNRLPAEKQRLDDERADLEAKLQRNKRDWERTYHNEIRARQAVDDQKVKITAARDSLTWYKQQRAERAAA
jgi:hypothetical protein